MAKTKSGRDPRSYSPTLVVRITKDQYETAKRSNSGGCLIADAIKRDYPHLSGVTSDMATVRATDREKGVRYMYLQPPAGQHILLSWDQGWPNPMEEYRIKGAVKIVPITRQATGKKAPAAIAARRQERIAELESKEASGAPLQQYDKMALTRMRNPTPTPERPTSVGPPEVHGSSRARPVVVGGRPLPHGTHPNLLRGRDRIFGAKLADPGLAFNEAVEAAVAERLAQEKQIKL